MKTSAGFKPALKVLLVYLVFMVLYGIYRAFPVFPLSIIAGTTESNFQHYKATFFSFLIVDLIEFLVCRKQITDRSAFWYGRLQAAVFAPWTVFLLWYIAPAVYGQFHPVVWEIVYANVMTIVATIINISFERAFVKIAYTPSLKAMIWGLVAVSLLLYMVFTFSHLPWADVFVEPNWR